MIFTYFCLFIEWASRM